MCVCVLKTANYGRCGLGFGYMYTRSKGLGFGIGFGCMRNSATWQHLSDVEIVALSEIMQQLI